MSHIIIKATLQAALEELAEELVNFDKDYQAILTEAAPNNEPSWLHKRTRKAMSDEAQLVKDFAAALQKEWNAWVGTEKP